MAKVRAPLALVDVYFSISGCMVHAHFFLTHVLYFLSLYKHKKMLCLNFMSIVSLAKQLFWPIDDRFLAKSGQEMIFYRGKTWHFSRSLVEDHNQPCEKVAFKNEKKMIFFVARPTISLIFLPLRVATKIFFF